MRFITITLAASLAFVLLASAAPAPAPIPQETPEELDCVNDCLTIEEECLLNSLSMSACVEAYDSCHLECVPETTVPEAPPAPAPPVNTQPLEPYDPNPSTNTKHQDVTEETQVGTPDLETEDQEDPYPTEEEMENTNQEVQETETEEVTEEEDGFIEIPAPPGGEDDEEFNDDPSDY